MLRSPSELRDKRQKSEELKWVYTKTRTNTVVIIDVLKEAGVPLAVEEDTALKEAGAPLAVEEDTALKEAGVPLAVEEDTALKEAGVPLAVEEGTALKEAGVPLAVEEGTAFLYFCVCAYVLVFVCLSSCLIFSSL
jgi:hypothetical protein